MFLFQGGTPTPASGYEADDVGKVYGVKEFKTALKGAVQDALSASRFVTFFTKLEDQAAKTSRKISAGISGNIDQIEKSMYDVFVSTQGIGGELSDTVDFITSLSDGLGKVPALFDDTVKRATALSKITGMSVKEIGEYTASFANIGMGQKQAMDNLTKIYANAKKFGVDSSKLTKTVTENIQKASSYGFKNGVEGLTKMAAQAQRLGISMDKMFGIAEKALDPEGAIEMAASMQMLGGNVGALADPFKLMYLAQNDIEGLQKEFIKAAESSATFNKETGQFEIKGQQMLRLRAQAEALGLSYDDIADAAIKAAKEQTVMSQIPLTAGLSEEQKGIISSLSEINNGVAEVRLPGTDQMVEVSKLTNEQIAALVTMNEDAAKLEGPNAKKGLDFSDLKNVAEKQFSQAEKQTIYLNEIRNALVTRPGSFNKGKDMPDAIAVVAGEAKKETVKQINDSNLLDTVTTAITTGIGGLSDYVANPTTGLKNHMETIIRVLTTASATDSTSIEDAFFPSAGPPKIMSEGKIFEGIRGDQVAVGPNLDSAFQMSAEQMRKTKAITEALGTNLEGVGDPFKNMVSSKLPPFMSDTSSKLQQTVSTINNNINVSGGANVSGSVDVKVTGSGLNLDDSKLSAMISSKVSAAIEERLSKRWGEKQGNIKTA